MSANDSEHFARESRSPPGTPFKKTHPSQRGGFFLFAIPSMLCFCRHWLVYSYLYRREPVIYPSRSTAFIVSGW